MDDVAYLVTAALHPVDVANLSLINRTTHQTLTRQRSLSRLLLRRIHTAITQTLGCSLPSLWPRGVVLGGSALWWALVGQGWRPKDIELFVDVRDPAALHHLQRWLQDAGFTIRYAYPVCGQFVRGVVAYSWSSTTPHPAATWNDRNCWTSTALDYLRLDRAYRLAGPYTEQRILKVSVVHNPTSETPPPPVPGGLPDFVWTALHIVYVNGQVQIRQPAQARTRSTATHNGAYFQRWLRNQGYSGHNSVELDPGPRHHN